MSFYPRSGYYDIYSLFNGPLGNASVTTAMGSVPVIVPAPSFFPQKFYIKRVDGPKHIYMITIDGKNTRNEKNLVYTSDKEAQKWVIAYRQPQNAFTIMKLNTHEVWTEPSQRRRDGRNDPHDPRQIRLKPLVFAKRGIYCYIRPNQLFRIEFPREHKLPDGTYRIHTLLSNQPLGIHPIMGRSPDSPAVVAVPGAAPQTFTLQQVKGSEDTYLIRIHGRFTQDKRNLFQCPPTQQWVITYRRQRNAFTIMKLNTHRAWTEPDQSDRIGSGIAESPHHICLEPLTTVNRGIRSDIRPNQLFRLEALWEHRYPNADPAAVPGRSAAPRRVQFKPPS
ncbi:hypothetical protein EDC04DRAFT_2894872 [Pisolithus marmoratus]|nr:hypothetical protein EDC04DRAFT_2894872 [Pisolithus marmoratus]